MSDEGRRMTLSQPPLDFRLPTSDLVLLAWYSRLDAFPSFNGARLARRGRHAGAVLDIPGRGNLPPGAGADLPRRDLELPRPRCRAAAARRLQDHLPRRDAGDRDARRGRRD